MKGPGSRKNERAKRMQKQAENRGDLERERECENRELHRPCVGGEARILHKEAERRARRFPADEIGQATDLFLLVTIRFALLLALVSANLSSFAFLTGRHSDLSCVNGVTRVLFKEFL